MFLEITGYIKSSFKKLVSKNTNKGIGSITNGDIKLEIQISNYSGHIFQRGQAVGMIGELCSRYNYPPYFKVTDMDQIKLLNKPKHSLEFLLKGYKYLS